MRDVWLPRNRANILSIRLGVQDQRLDGCAGRRLAIGPPGQDACPHLTKAQRDWLVIVRSDFDDHFRHRPVLIAKLSQVQDAMVEAAIDPERPASDELYIAIGSQGVKVLHLRWAPNGAILRRRSQWRRDRCRANCCSGCNP